MKKDDIISIEIVINKYAIFFFVLWVKNIEDKIKRKNIYIYVASIAPRERTKITPNKNNTLKTHCTDIFTIYSDFSLCSLLYVIIFDKRKDSETKKDKDKNAPALFLFTNEPKAP